MANIQQIFCQTYLPIGLPNEQFHALAGDLQTPTLSEERVQRLWPSNATGRLRNWRVVLDEPVPADIALTIIVRINEADTAMAIPFETGEQSGTYGGSINVNALDRVNVRTVVTGTGLVGVSHAKWNLEYEPSVGSISVYGSNQTDGNAISPIYYPVFAGFSNAGGHFPVEQVVSVSPCDGTITFLGVILEEVNMFGAAEDTHKWTLVKSTDNGANWIDQDGTGGTPDTRVLLAHGSHPRWDYATFSCPVSAGDLFYIRYDRLVGPEDAINVYGGVSIAFDPAIEGEFIVPGMSFNQLGTVDDVYYWAGAGSNDFSAPEPTGILTGVKTITVSRFRVFLQNAPGSGNNYQLDFTISGNTDPVVGTPILVMGDSTQAAVDLEHQLVLTLADDTFDLREIPTSGPTTGYMTWGLVGRVGIEQGVIGPLLWIHWPRVVQ